MASHPRPCHLLRCQVVKVCTEYLQTHALPLIKAGALTELFGATMVGLKVDAEVWSPALTR